MANESKGEMIGWDKLSPAQRLKARRLGGKKATAGLTKEQLRARAQKGVRARWGSREERRARKRQALKATEGATAQE